VGHVDWNGMSDTRPQITLTHFLFAIAAIVFVGSVAPGLFAVVA
jgi:hypothetical protein